MKYLFMLVLIISLCYKALSFQKYELNCDAQILNTTLKIADNQIGTLEYDCRNRGEINKYLELFNAPEGSPYCLAGIYYCFYNSCLVLKKHIDLIPIPKTMLANNVFDYAKKFGNRTIYKAQSGNLIIWRKSQSIYGHIELIRNIYQKGWIETIGFNTQIIINNKKKCGVFIHKRNIYHPLGAMLIRGLVGFKQI